MKTFAPFLFAIAVMFCACEGTPPVEAVNEETAEPSNEVSFYTADSLKIFADLYEQDKAGTTILLFHQGGSNARGEYAPIIPRLLEKGYNILAVDQIAGGQVHGSYNRTIAIRPNHTMRDNYTYCAAYDNLQTALDYVIDQGFTGKKVLWGSSYSAALVIQLGVERPDDVAAVLGFSPASGDPMEGCNPESYIEAISLPLLVTRPKSEMEYESVQTQHALAESLGHTVHIADPGSHGSSMLVAERSGGEVEATWEVVWAFLEEVEG